MARRAWRWRLGFGGSTWLLWDATTAARVHDGGGGVRALAFIAPRVRQVWKEENERWIRAMLEKERDGGGVVGRKMTPNRRVPPVSHRGSGSTVSETGEGDVARALPLAGPWPYAGHEREERSWALVAWAYGGKGRGSG
jgi:hypothetical protein